MFKLNLPMWLRIILWVIKVLAEASPPKNGSLAEDEGDNLC
jgi:hypothetical protein